MAKFDLKKAILENKATFFGSLTEGQFSWFTQDTGQQIGSEEENTIPVFMFDDKGKYYYEKNYDGYGDFGGKDYYELLAQMNGYAKGDRMDGIDMAFGKMKTPNGGPVLFPALVTKPNEFNFKTHDFTKEAESDPNQSWYVAEEDDFYDQNDEKEYRYNEDEEELDENKEIKPTTKMKISELKAKIKEMVLNEMEKDVDYTNETAGYDFLAELEGMLDEAEETKKDTAEAEDVTDGEETVDVTDDFSTEEPQGPGGIDVTQNANADLTGTKKEVQDNLEAALEAARTLGDEKLATQVGNTITFFNKQHVVKDTTVAEADLMKNIGKGLEYESTEEMILNYAQHLMDEGSYDVEELAQSYLDIPRSFPKQLDYTFFKNNYDDILSVAMTGLGEGKKEKDVAKDLNESMFPMLKKILK